jgi:Zn-finger nucleic acid-binding protein
MFKGSRFCAQCGAEAFREVVEDAPLPCPRCKATMQALKLGATRANECAECGGLWLDAQSLQRLVDQREQHASIIGELSRHVPATRTPETIRYVPCPRCTKLMNRVNFAHSSGVILDVCKSDGVWLDRGELQRVLGFVDAGGLTAQRARELEQLVEEQRRLRALKDSSPHALNYSVNIVHLGSTGRRSRDSGDTPLDSLLFDIAGLFNT